MIDYKAENIGEKAKASKYAPFAVIMDCVGGTEVIPYMDQLLLDDPKHPELGVYVSISGDSMCLLPWKRFPADIQVSPGEPMNFGPAIVSLCGSGDFTLTTANPVVTRWSTNP
jgi:hypothetical protein